jgi:hypothetical protein
MIPRLNNQAFYKAWYQEITREALLVRASAYDTGEHCPFARERPVIWTRKYVAIGIDYQQDGYRTNELQSPKITNFPFLAEPKKESPEINESKADSDKNRLLFGDETKKKGG